MGSLFQELRRRKVFSVTAVYAVVAWLLIQIADVILPTFNAPQWVNQTLIVVLMLGFPIAAVLAWAFDLSPDGLDAGSTQNAVVTSTPANQSWNSVVLGLLVLAMVFLLVDRYWLTGSQPVQITSVDESHELTRSSINLGYLSRRVARDFLADVALTPDGSKLVYRSTVDNRTQLYLRDLSTFTSRGLLENPNNLNIILSDQSVSPDGKYVFVLLGNEPFMLSLENGSRRQVKFVSERTISNTYTGRGYDWFSDDEIIYSASDGAIYLNSFFNGEVSKIDIPKLDSETLIWPQVLADSRYVLYTATEGGEVENADIAIFDRNTGETLTLVEDGFHARYVASGHIVFLRNNELRAIAFDLSRMQVIGSDVAVINDVQSVSGSWGRANFAISESGRLIYGQGSDLVENTARRFELRELEGLIRPLNITATGWGRIRLSPDGEKLLLHAESSGSTGDVFIYYIDSEVLDRRTFSGVRTPIWSLDGDNFVYIDTADGIFNLQQMATSGVGRPELLYSTSARIEPFDFTPDGSQLLYTTGLQGSENLNAVPLNHEAPIPVALVSDESSNDTNISISPDGRWITYNASSYNIFIRPYPDIEEGIFQLTQDGGTQEPRWGPNSDELFYYERGNLMRVQLFTDSGFRWGQPEVIFSDLSAAGNGLFYDMTADGKTFLVSIDIAETEGLSTPQFTALNLVDNWFEELRRLAPTATQ